ncbi:MAG: RnfABCDGE type electron transport complex subunit D [Candidatus Riflebacteria bacterium]|nr:RnfABCDGE type electron transport complex subunit D [Candidatus Riflebacteria bacterium]
MNKQGAGYYNLGGADWLLLLVLLPLYFAVWGRFGQKFAAAASLSLATGVCCWLVALVMQPAGDDQKAAEMPFCWSLFLLFPLFCPLGLALQLIPFILILTYLISITSFGGFRRHFFNPVAVAVILLLVGYNSTASLSASKPLQQPYSGYRLWTAGVPPTRPLWFFYAAVPAEELASAGTAGKLPALPGSVFTFPLLLLSGVLALVFARRRIWWLTACLSVMAFAALAKHWGLVAFSPLHPLLLGLVPSLTLAAVADYHTLPKKTGEQIISALLFAVLVLLFTVKSENPLGPVFALLLMQVLSPLLCDLLPGRKVTSA